MTWLLSKTELDNENLLVIESLFSLGNGYLGVRGNFEEGYPEHFQSIRGTYINAYHDETEITYGEKLYGFPDKQQKLVNLIDSQTVEVHIDDEVFSMFTGEILSFERRLHLDKGYSERIIHWKSPKGKEAKFHFKRLVSFVTRELFAIDIKVEPLHDVEEVKFISTVNGDVANFTDENDPRIASGHAKRLSVVHVKKQEKMSIVQDKTLNTDLYVACVSHVNIKEQATTDYTKTADGHHEIYTVKGAAHFTKYNVYTDTLRHGSDVVDAGIKINEKIKGKSFDALLLEQKNYLDEYWRKTDIRITGNDHLQEGIRFNLFHLLQSVGKDPVSNIAAKGLSGEGYEGHYFWDTEIYIFPVFLMTNPDIAKNLLLNRYSILDNARARAKEMGHEQGALFPWRTITGQESSAFFPAGTAQYHISADIAYSYIQYYIVTKDEEFLQDYMAEILFETARLWIDMGHFKNGEFRIDSVTGPDEYTCIVNNNYYTNVMAKHNLLWAYKVYDQLNDNHELSRLSEKLKLDASEAEEWLNAGENMYLPYSEELKINAQDDSFLQKAHWDIESIPEEKFPLLLNYHPLTLYRYQICKQADTVLGHFLLEDEVDLETIKHSYDYYEKITTHDSSLSHCVFSIMASKLGYKGKAYQYFNETARLDLENTHENTRDGLHMANMGGTWLAIVYGFAGVRIKESGLSLDPDLPKEWGEIEFKLQYLGNLLEIKMERDTISYTLLDGSNLMIRHKGKELKLERGNELVIINGH